MICWIAWTSGDWLLPMRAILITVLCIQYGRDAVFAAEGTLQNTALSLVTIPLLLWLLG